MAEKIKIKSSEKTPEYIDREWAQVLAQRQYLLSTSDWTQLEDNELTFESRIRWNHWRNQVRAVRRSTVSSKDIAEAKLKELEAKLPEREFITSRTARQKKYHLDLNDLGQAKADAILILKMPRERNGFKPKLCAAYYGRTERLEEADEKFYRLCKWYNCIGTGLVEINRGETVSLEGFDHDELREFLANKNDYIGKWIKYTGMAPTKNVPRHAHFSKGNWRDEK